MYWIIHLFKRQYFEVVDDGTFFDGDWKQKTPWKDEQYVNLAAQKIYTDQSFDKYLFYNYDLCMSGMIVGLYYDTAQYSPAAAEMYLNKLKRQHDVARVMRYGLQKV